MSAIITWMILERCLDVGRQYFFIGFLFWHSIYEEMCHKILIKGGKKSIFYNPIYFFYDLIHLISILLKIQSI